MLSVRCASVICQKNLFSSIVTLFSSARVNSVCVRRVSVDAVANPNAEQLPLRWIRFLRRSNFVLTNGIVRSDWLQCNNNSTGYTIHLTLKRSRASPCHRTPNKFQFSRHRTKLKYTLVSTAPPMPSDRCHNKARRHRWCVCIGAITISYIIPSPSRSAIVTPIALRHIHCHFCKSNLPDIDAKRCAAAREYQSKTTQ